MDMGVVIPTVRLRDNGLINPNQYIIKIKGEEIAKGEVLVGYYLALDPANTSEPIDGIETIEPAYGIKGKWITENEKELAGVYGYTVIDAPFRHCDPYVRSHQETHARIVESSGYQHIAGKCFKIQPSHC